MASQDRDSEPSPEETSDASDAAASSKPIDAPEASDAGQAETSDDAGPRQASEASETSPEASEAEAESNEPEKPGEPSEPSRAASTNPPAHQLPLFRDLGARGQLLRSIVIVFTIFHLGAMLVGSAIPSVRNKFKPILGFYSDGLRMSNSWGMFGKPPNATHIVVEAVMRDGTVHVVSTTNAAERTLYERIRDVRIRKVQAKLAEQGDRGRFGGVFLEYFCRQATERFGSEVRDVRARNVLHQTRDDTNRITRNESSSIVLSRRCSDPRARIPPRRPVAPQFREGNDPPNEGGDL